MKTLTKVITFAALSLAGCGDAYTPGPAGSGTPQGEKTGAPSALGTSVTLSEGGSFAGEQSTLTGRVMPDGSLRWSFILFAQRGDQAYQVVWDEMVSLPASLPLGGPKDAATAAVVSTYSRMSPTDQTISSSGALALTFSAGKVAGTVQGLPTVLDASFVADLRVECLVPPDAAAADGAHGNGPVHSVVDAAMADPGCAPMRALR